jgi:hypothetical protein
MGLQAARGSGAASHPDQAELAPCHQQRLIAPVLVCRTCWMLQRGHALTMSGCRPRAITVAPEREAVPPVPPTLMLPTTMTVQQSVAAGCGATAREMPPAGEHQAEREKN